MRILPKFFRAQNLALFLALIPFTAGAAWAGVGGAVNVTIVTPQSGGIIHESVNVNVTVTSDFELATVVADLDGTLANLAFTGSDWSTTIDMTGASWGAKTLTVTATDLFANQGMSTIPVNFDLPPVITVITPQDFDAVGKTFQVQATCQDDGPTGCTRVEMRHSAWGLCSHGATVVGNNGSTLDKTANLQFNNHGERLSTCVQGIDSAGQIGGELVHLWIIDSLYYTEVDEASGQIVDVTEDRLLFTGNVTSGFGEPVGVRERATGIETTVFDNLNNLLESSSARLTPLGLISPVQVNNVGWSFHLWDWRSDGTLHDVGSFLAQPLDAQGSWAAWVHRVGSNDQLTRRDLTNETDQIVATDVAGYGLALSPDGSIIYSSSPDYDLVRFDGTSVVTLVSDPPVRNFAPKTDGGAIAYSKQRLVGASTWEFTTGYFANGVETLLAPFHPDHPRRFAVSGDWVAFGRLGTTNQDQVWLRAPDGTETQITFFSTNSRVESVSPGGTLTYTTGLNSVSLFLHNPYTLEPVFLGSTQDKNFWFNRRLYRTAGRKLFEISIEIFSDDFENGTMTPWSIVTP